MKLEISKGAQHDINVVGGADGVFVEAVANLTAVHSVVKVDLEFLLKQLAEKIPGTLDDAIINLMITTLKS